MDEVGVGLLFFLVMVASFWLGMTVQPVLRETHRSRESVDSIRVVITLLVTFAAVVLGLLISSTNARFTAIQDGLRGLSVDLTELDDRLRDYGPAADPIRAGLIRYTKAAIADTWPDETAPPGDYPRQLESAGPGSAESVVLTALLHGLTVAIRSLTPRDEVERELADGLREQMARLQDQRLMLIETARPALSWPSLLVIMFWLSVIFVIAGLSSSRNGVVLAVTVLAALSLASSIYLAADLDTPLSGFITVSSAPLRDALTRITRPPLPPGAP